MEELFMLPVIGITALLVYKYAYDILWYKLQNLFELIPSSSSSHPYSSAIASINKSQNGFLYKLYTEYSVSSNNVLRVIRTLVSGTLALCVVAVEIVLWQIKTADSSKGGDVITDFMWPASSALLAASLILIQPFCILITMLNKFFEDRLAIDKLLLCSCAAATIWILGLYQISFGPFYYSSSPLTRLSLVGVTIMGVLSGIASMSTPYYVARFLLNWQKDAPVVLNHAFSHISMMYFSTAMIQERMQEYESNVEQNVLILKKLEQSPGGLDSVMREQLLEKIGRYQLQIAKLEIRLKESREITLAKRIFHLGFLCYCVYKLVSTFLLRVPQIITHAVSYPSDYDYKKFYSDEDSLSSGDPLAVTLANVFDLFFFGFDHQQDLDSLTKQISLLVSLSLFICSLSTVTTTISYLLTLLPAKLQILAFATIQDNADKTLPIHTKENKSIYGKKPSIIKNLVVSELTGVYLLSTILLIRSNLPNDVSRNLNTLLGENFALPNIAIDIWFDEVFAVSAILTLIGIVIVERTVTRTF